MNALDAMMARAQPGYEVAVREIATTFRTYFGAACFEGLEPERLPDVLAALLEKRPVTTTESASAVVLRHFTILEWCCGLAVGVEAKKRVARLMRRDYRLQFEAAGVRRPKADVAARRSHVVFVGSLGTPLHSPSIGAAAYLRALAADPKNRKIEVFHYGPINEELGALMREQLPAWIKFHQIENTPDYLGQAIARAPSTFHFWCYPRTNITLSFMAMYGPTLMFTCADDPPEQYCDAYWSCRPAEHIAKVWGAAPPSFIDNFVTSKAADFEIMPATNVRSKTAMGMPETDVLLASVGNRMAVDLDETFVNGMEKILRARPHCRWLLVGALPDNWLNALRTVLGPQFLHIPFEPDLTGLMAAVDVYVNPFRRGGGNSAIIAGCAGAPILTRNDIGEVAACAPAEHSAPSAEDYFAKLERLVDDAEHRAQWSVANEAFLKAWLDKSLYASELDRIVAKAFERFRSRASRSMDVVFPDTALAAAAAA